MGLFLLRRATWFLVTMLGASLFIFGTLALLGGDPVTALLGPEASPGAIAELRERFGLNVPLWEQYLVWMRGLLTLDLGRSVFSQQDVGQLIVEKSTVTVPLAVYSLLIAALVGIPIGAFSAMRHRRLSGAVVSGVSQIGIALPAFWFGMLLIVMMSVRLGWFPPGGFDGWDAGVSRGIVALTLPALSLGLIRAAVLARYTRASVIDVRHENYIRTARAKGMTFGQAMWRHGARNAALVVVTILGIQFGIAMGGSVVIETVFYLPGLGRMVITALGQRDLILVRSTVMVIVAVIVIVNFMTDLLYGVLDPRTKTRSAA